jgi:hypothetical protein
LKKIVNLFRFKPLFKKNHSKHCGFLARANRPNFGAFSTANVNMAIRIDHTGSVEYGFPVSWETLFTTWSCTGRTGFFAINLDFHLF